MTCGAGASFLVLGFGTARCNHTTGPIDSNVERPVLRLGVSNAPALSTERGVRQFILNLSSEGLLRVNQEGRLEAWLAEGWKQSADGLTLTIRLRDGVKFHDGTSVDAAAIVAILNDNLTKSLKYLADDVASISARGSRDIDIRFRRPSSMFADSLMDVQIVKDDTAVGTAGFMASASGAGTVAPFDDYYLGRPGLGGLTISSYRNARAAWADLLRDQIDMLYEVGTEAIEALQGARNISLYTFDRPYQYGAFLNTRNPKLRSPEVRQALNEAIDRAALVRAALGGHGTPSAGPVSPRHWAFTRNGDTFEFKPQSAIKKLGKPLELKCVTIAEAPFDQIALVVKQQLKAVGVDLDVEGVPMDQVVARLARDDFEIVLAEFASGWSLSRPYRYWHSHGTLNSIRFASEPVDLALDRMRHSVNDDEYRAAVAAFQQAVADDPPAMFLAWSERSRAISSRFDVQPQPGRDVLSTLRLWHLSTDKPNATKH
jgi:peptide/nickel transport system substrate-binding protein